MIDYATIEHREDGNAFPFPEMLTIKETARRCKMPEHAIRMMVKSNQIPHVTIGETRKVLINYSKFAAMLNNL